MSLFYQPPQLEEALALLSSKNAPTPLAGGTDLVVARREGRRKIAAYLDVTRIAELRQLQQCENVVTIGAAVSFSELERSALLQSHFPLLCRAAASIGSPQVRSRGTVGGNVANASPAADLVPALTALEAVALVQSARGARCVPVAELITGASKTSLLPGELIVSFSLPLSSHADMRQDFLKVGRRNALSIARLNGACTLAAQNGRILEARLCIGAVTDRPQRFAEAEALLAGQSPSKTLFLQAGELVSAEVLRQTGQRASSAYKLPVIKEFTKSLLCSTWGDEIE